MVAGQEDKHFHNVASFPTEAEFAKEVKDLPSLVNEKILGEGTDLVPTREAGSVIKCTITHGKWNFFKFSDTFSIYGDGPDEPFAGGAYIKQHSNLLGKGRLVLYDAQDNPICLAVEDKNKINHHYKIYGRFPLNSVDEAAEKEQGVDFFPWFHVRDISDTNLDHRTVLVWNGTKYQQMLRINPAPRLPDSKIGDLVPPLKQHNMVCDKDDPSLVYALLSKTSDKRVAGWDLCIAPGADPVHMIMLAAVMDDMVGWFA